jgi:kinesin family protein 4/21/27
MESAHTDRSASPQIEAARDAMLATEEPVATTPTLSPNATNATNPATDANPATTTNTDAPPPPPAAAAPPAAPPAPQTADASSERIRVAVRVRPGEGAPSVALDATRVTLRTATGEKRFDFDGVLDQAATQAEVYDATAASLVARVFEGYNATVMAYGQTGSGKTHTMGEPLDALSTSPGDDGEGVIGRALGEVFARRAASPEATTIHLSYLEVYNECVYDLLATHDDREPLGVREDGGAVVVPGLSEHDVAARGAADALLHRGALRRRTGATKMNAGSSRSHALLTVRVATASGAVGKLVLVDLAGSERATRTGAEGARLNEGIMINKGLLALGNVVSALAERTEASGAARHVPFRDSKLTRLLRDSLGGSARTYMVACVSPCAADADETANTLRYASRARFISNVAVRHAVAETPERALIASLRKENATLRARLAAGGAAPAARVEAADAEALFAARRGQRSAEAALAGARADALAATLAVDRYRLAAEAAAAPADDESPRLDLVRELRAELADARAEAAALRGADDAEAEEASQLAASHTLAEEERQMAALRAQFAEAVESLDAEVGALERARDAAAADLERAKRAGGGPADAALRDALARRKAALDAKKKELEAAKKETARVEGLRRRAESEASKLRVAAETAKRRRVDAEKKLRGEAARRVDDRKAATLQLARAKRGAEKSAAELAKLRGLEARLEAHVSNSVAKFSASKLKTNPFVATTSADARLALRWYHNCLVKAKIRAARAPPTPKLPESAKKAKARVPLAARPVRPRGLPAQAPARRLALSGQKKAVRFDDDDSDSAWESDDADDDDDSEDERKPRKASEPRRAPEPAAGDGLDAMTVPELKDLLRPAGLKLSGRKSELVARLRDHRGARPAAAPADAADPAAAPADAAAVCEDAEAMLARLEEKLAASAKKKRALLGDSPARSPLVDATNRGA